MVDRIEEISLLVIDDNELLAETYQRWLGSMPGMRYLGCTPDLVEAGRIVEQERPAVVLLDLVIPGADTLGFLRRTAATHPNIRVVMHSAHQRPKDMDRALDEGASGVIVKDESPAAILAAIRRAAPGELVLSTVSRGWTPDH